MHVHKIIQPCRRRFIGPVFGGMATRADKSAVRTVNRRLRGWVISSMCFSVPSADLSARPNGPPTPFDTILHPISISETISVGGEGGWGVMGGPLWSPVVSTAQTLTP